MRNDTPMSQASTSTFRISLCHITSLKLYNIINGIDES